MIYVIIYVSVREHQSGMYPAESRNLPVAPFRFRSHQEFTRYKKLCEEYLHNFYTRTNETRLPEQLALSVLRANVKKRYEHQLRIDETIDPNDVDSYRRMMQDGLSKDQYKVIRPGNKFKRPIDLFLRYNLPSIEVGFRIVTDQYIDPFNFTSTGSFNGPLPFDLMSIGHASDPGNSVKVPRIIADRNDEGYAVIKTKVIGGRVMGHGGDYIESVGRRTGVVPIKGLSSDGVIAVSGLAFASKLRGESDEESISKNKDELLRLLQDSGYIPCIERYYLRRRNGEKEA